MSTVRVRVARKTTEALDICSFELVAMDGAPLPAFTAGSHIDVHLPGGLTRPYSLCNDPTETHRYRIGVLRDPASRGGSMAMHTAVAEGDVLEISAPKNHFALAPEATRSLLLAGGIGITPILAMAQTLAQQGAPLEMHYCTRAEERMAFRSEIAAAAFARDVHLHFDDGSSMQKLSLPDLLAEPQPGVHLYVCGPTGFMDAVLATARASGWPEAQLHYEFFSANVAPSANDASFEVKLASSGRVVRIAADQTVAKALALAGVDIPLSCEQGVCGTCLTKVLEGEPDHKDFYLTPEEQAANDQFTPCCSRSKSALLVLDL
ncbi:PDR/VanB family oxidoreductase [Rhodoferax sp.]|uniref:PDR/VanB family oxidoreductase n=1 Tax=Rhodoferax sp. TaxID=50421 RepID=UPI0025F0163F|nr:PDR/VanB family oxidoreductase [Rhodoferax sp.]